METIKYILNTDPFCAIITFLIVALTLILVFYPAYNKSKMKALKKFFETLVLILLLTSCFRQLNKTPVSWIVTEKLTDTTYYCISTDSLYSMSMVYYDSLGIGEIIPKFIEKPNGDLYKKHSTENNYNNIVKESYLMKR
jgi:hypothetical protein